MPLTFETGKNAPKVPNQPKFSRLVIALSLATGGIVAYHKSERVQHFVTQAVSNIQKNLPDAIKQAKESPLPPR